MLDGAAGDARHLLGYALLRGVVLRASDYDTLESRIRELEQKLLVLEDALSKIKTEAHSLSGQTGNRILALIPTSDAEVRK